MELDGMHPELLRKHRNIVRRCLSSLKGCNVRRIPSRKARGRSGELQDGLSNVGPWEVGKEREVYSSQIEVKLLIHWQAWLSLTGKMSLTNFIKFMEAVCSLELGKNNPTKQSWLGTGWLKAWLQRKDPGVLTDKLNRSQHHALSAVVGNQILVCFSWSVERMARKVILYFHWVAQEHIWSTVSVSGYSVKDEQTEMSPVESQQDGQQAGAHGVYREREKAIFRPGKVLMGKSRWLSS